jgi:hypothetical protein
MFIYSAQSIFEFTFGFGFSYFFSSKGKGEILLRKFDPISVRVDKRLSSFSPGLSPEELSLFFERG